MNGIVVHFDTPKGFGFIRPEGGGDDVFCHYSNIEMDGFRKLERGDRVEYEVEVGGPNKKLQAVHVRPIKAPIDKSAYPYSVVDDNDIPF